MRALLASILLCGCIQWEGDLMGLFLPRQDIISPIGLVTQPNKFGQYPSGALKVARNWLLRNPGELVQAPDVQGVQSVGASNNVLLKLFPLDEGHVYSFHRNGTTWSVFDINSSAAFPANYSSTNALSSVGFVNPARVAERMIVNGLRGALVVDYMQPSTAGERALRAAGLPQPSFNTYFTIDSGNGFLPNSAMVGYAMCFYREFSDGYAVRSVPSAVASVRNDAGSSRNVQFQLTWSSDAGLVAGDVIEIYRTDLLLSAPVTADPGSTLKRVLAYALTSSDIGASQATVTDRQMPIGTTVTPGEELYCNPGQEGAGYENRQPPSAACQASFKGFAFFGNTTERGQWVFSVPGGMGPQNAANAPSSAYFKAYSIGTRLGAGTITNGSAVITAVSAADLVGVRAGQRWAGANPPFPSNATVLTVGGTSITMSTPATGGAAAWSLDDVVEIDGNLIRASDIGSLFFNQIGQYELTADTVVNLGFGDYTTGFVVTIEAYRPWRNNGTLTVRGTNGNLYSPPIPEIGLTAKTFNTIVRPNRLQWSKEQQPEHAPSANEAFVGFGKIYALNATRDALWIWCSDGLFRLSGNAGALGLGEWQIDYANSTLILAAPQASTVLNESLYAYTNVGFVEVDSAGNVTNLTEKVIGDLLPGQKYVETAGIVVERNEKDDEIVLILGDNGSGSSNTVYVFSVSQRGWTTLGSNGANLSNITALAMQRSPVSGEPRLLFGVSPLAGGSPSYSGWNSTSAFLTAEAQYQPIYGDAPLDLKEWIWADFISDAGSAGKTLVPTWNGTQYGGTVPIVGFDGFAWARAGAPLAVKLSHAVSPGFSALSGAPQTKFEGISLAVKVRSNVSKKR